MLINAIALACRRTQISRGVISARRVDCNSAQIDIRRFPNLSHIVSCRACMAIEKRSRGSSSINTERIARLHALSLSPSLSLSLFRIATAGCGKDLSVIALTADDGNVAACKCDAAKFA